MSTRKEILEMLSRGEIDVARATDLLNSARESADSAYESEPEPASPLPPNSPAPPRAPVPPAPPVNAKGRWLHIHVSDLESGRQRVRVNVPLGLVNFGLKIGSRFTNEIDNDTVHQVMDALQDPAITGTLVEVEDLDDNERVHLFID